MGTRVWVAETLWCASKTVTRLLISYTPRYNKKLKPNKNRNGATRKNISITNTMTKVFVVVCLFESCLMGSILQWPDDTDIQDTRLWCCCSCSVAQSCLTLRPRGLESARLLCPWDFPDKNTEVGYHFLLQEIFQTQRSNPALLLGRQILFTTKPPGKPVICDTVIQNNSWEHRCYTVYLLTALVL